jgi:hypothetical protein
MASNVVSSESSSGSLVCTGATAPRPEVKTICDMGFSAAAAQNALERCGYDVQHALAMYIFCFFEMHILHHPNLEVSREYLCHKFEISNSQTK